jgi:hypothetical protein
MTVEQIQKNLAWARFFGGDAGGEPGLKYY